MTNADHIRAMSVEELAALLVQDSYECDCDYDYEDNPVENWSIYYFCSDGESFYTADEAVEHEIEWLKRDYAEPTETR